MDELALAIQAAGDDPEELRQVALRFNLDPAFVASVAAGTSRTTMGQSFSLPLLLSSGIIPPEQLSAGFAQAEGSALREAMQDWDEAYAELIPDAPTFNRFEEAKYADNPVVAEFFQAIRLGTPLVRVQTGEAYQELKTSMNENDQKAEFAELEADLGTFDKAFSKHQQELYAYETSGNSPKLQAAIAALGERPTAETFDTSSARFDYAKALGLPALALLPDPSEGASAQEVIDYMGGSKMHQSLIDYVNSFRERADARKDLPVSQSIRGYGAIGREPEGVAPLSSIPLSARGGSGMDVYERIADTPESQRVQGLQGAAATTGRAPQAPKPRRGLSQQQIRELDLKVAAKKEAELAANLAYRKRLLEQSQPSPFQRALDQYRLFGALEANV